MKLYCLLPLLIPLAGCSQEDTQHIQNDAQAMAKDAGQAATSLTLAGKVNGVLRVMKRIDGSDVHVEAKDGVVTLSGSAVDENQKKFIDDTAQDIKGVQSIVDHMVVAK